uniref:AsIV-cont00056-ORF1 n=1 Tax=Apophua simplicipes ichnovirus TaxID=1329648 RepID=S5DR71_9VIRU|nr:AsIV-cont00056-ORF1 [Apophua simplicipes ichnovirus]
MNCVVDMQGFKQSGGKFVLKEFAMVIIDVKKVKHLEFIVKPPYPFDNLFKEDRAANLWLTHNLHGISWKSGTIPYEESRLYVRKLLKNARTVYVRGSGKKAWLRSLLNFSVDVVDLKELECPSTKELKESLNYTCASDQYEMGFASAGENVKLMRLWMLQKNIAPHSAEKNFLQRILSM